MRRGWLNRTLMLALATALFASGCEQGPSEPQFDVTEQSQEEVGPREASPVTDLVVGSEYTLVKALPASSAGEGQLRSNGLLGGLVGLVVKVLNVVVGIIGLDGGSLTVQNHWLVVPAGAVTLPTTFKMEVLRSNHVAVDLSAYRRWVDVGEKGFEKPVTISLSYANADVEDPTKLYILRYNENGQHERLPSVVDLEKKTVSAQLDHFSKYCMATN